MATIGRQQLIPDKFMPWRRGAVDITSASGTRRPGFEYLHGIRIFGNHSSAVVYKMIALP
jgi:hypothetical protein